MCHCLCVHVCTCVLGSGGRLERTSPSSPECTLHRLGASPVLFQTIFSPVVEPYSSQKWQASLCSHAGASIPVLTHCFSACEQRKAQRGAIEAPSRHMWICVLHVRTLERALPHLRKRGGGGWQLGEASTSSQRRRFRCCRRGAEAGAGSSNGTAPRLPSHGPPTHKDVLTMQRGTSTGSSNHSAATQWTTRQGRSVWSRAHEVRKRAHGQYGDNSLS